MPENAPHADRRPWIDGHLDLAWIALAGGGLDEPADGETTSVSWADLDEAGIGGLFATIFTEMDGDPTDPASYPAGDAEAAARAAWLAKQQSPAWGPSAINGRERRSAEDQIAAQQREREEDEEEAHRCSGWFEESVVHRWRGLPAPRRTDSGSGSVG